MVIETINFTGAQGTGKTTVLKALQEMDSFSSYDFVTEVVRDFVREKGIKINRDGTTETQNLLFEAYQKNLSRKNPYISDRCLIDVCAYTHAGYNTFGLTDQEKADWEKTKDFQLEKIKEAKNQFGLVFYFPIEFPIVGDGTRSTDKDYQAEIDGYIYKILRECEIPFIQITGSVEERVRIIEQALLHRK